jgi:beta-galactosidase
MNRSFFILCIVAWFLPLSYTVSASGPQNRVWLFSYFINNGEDGLRLAWSKDGLNWNRLREGKSWLQPEVGREKLMRDPSVVRGPDGTFHMVWSASWEGHVIGYASSQDLIHWSIQQAIPVMEHEPTARNSWAPELFYDDKEKLFYIIWASTIPEKFPETAGSSETDYNHRLYYTTTKDFKTFAKTAL